MSCGRSTDIIPPLTAQTPRRLQLRKGAICLIAPFLGLLCFCLAARATDPTEQIAELNHRQWTTREQAPAEIGMMAQTGDGFLWLASSNGLIRFDGAHFQRFAMPDGSEPMNGDISAVFHPVGNDLWVGLRFGGAYLIHDGRLSHYGEEEGLPPHSVIEFAQQDDGTMWVQTTVGLYRLKEGRWIAVKLGAEAPEGVGWSVYVDRSNTVWVLGDEGIYFLSSGATSFAKSSLPGGRGMIAMGPDGAPWVSQQTYGLHSLSNPQHYISGRALGATEVGTGAFLVDRDNVLWTFANPLHAPRLVRVPDIAAVENRDVASLDTAQYLKSNQALSSDFMSERFLEDAEANVWLPNPGGLDCFGSNKLHSAIMSVTLDEPAAAVDRDGAIWLATQQNLLLFSSNRNSPTFVNRESMVDTPSSLFLDDDASAWVGMEGSQLTHFYNDRFHAVELPKAVKGIAIHAVTRDSSGTLWIAVTGMGLFRQSGKEWVRNGGLTSLPAAAPVSVFRDLKGRLWLGYPDSRVAVIDGTSRVQVYDGAAGLDVGAVLAIAVHDERVWVSGTQGVSLYRQGRFVPLRGADGTPFTGISGIVQGTDGGLWMNGGSAVTHVPSAEIDAFIAHGLHHVKTESLTYEDGLRGSAVQLRPLPTAVATGDGRLWFMTTRGAYWIDPLHIRTNSRPPPVTIESVTANGRRYLANGDSIRLPVHTTSFEVDYTATSVSSPSRVQFRYHMSGVDGNWQDAGNRRQAFYTNVSPGLHQFRVTAANEDGVWNTTGATFGIILAPAFYQTPWFYALCTLASLALLWQIYRFRLHQLRLRLDERVKERERIARELHDTLLQGAQGMILIFQGFAGQLDRHSPMRERMEIALDQADHLLNEARGRVSELRGIGVDGDLAQALRRSAQEIFNGSDLQFDVTSTGSPIPLIRSSADEICLIAREAMSNARRHARATSVEIDIVFDIRELRILVRDDGAGIDPALLEAGRSDHYGLQGMKERAERLGAQLHFWGRPGAGTEVELIAPARSVYCSTNGVLIRRLLSSWRRSRPIGAHRANHQ